MHFTQADTIVPNSKNSIALDRCAYAYNNPLKYNDPSGHYHLCILAVFAAAAIILPFVTTDSADIERILTETDEQKIDEIKTSKDAAFTIMGIGVGITSAITISSEIINYLSNKYTNVNKNYEPIKEKTSLDFSAKIYLKNSGRGNKLQNHHVATEKNSSFTPKFKGIIEKHGLDLNDDWNIVKIPHSGRHPNDYHEWVFNGM